MLKATITMKRVLLLASIFSITASYSQDQPPGLIYTCQKKINGNTQYDIFNSSGQKILKNSVDWAYSNPWTWLFVMDTKTKLITVYNYDGEKLGIDSIESSHSTYLNLNRIGLKRKGKWGFYDRQGKLKIPHLYDEIGHFKDNRVSVKSGNEIFFIDSNGVKVDFKYNPSDFHHSFQDDDIAIGMGGEFYYKGFKKLTENGKTGLLGAVDNKILVPAEYDELVDIKGKFKVVTAGRNGKYGLIAFGGKIVIPIEYERIFVLNDYF